MIISLCLPTEMKICKKQPQLNFHSNAFNQRQLFLQMCCLCSLWNFGETIEDRRFLLSKDIFPLSVDALLLQTVPLKETSHIDISSMVVNVNETAIGCFAG